MEARRWPASAAHPRAAVLVHVPTGVEPPGVGRPLPEREPGERRRPHLDLALALLALLALARCAAVSALRVSVVNSR
ncbi:hypothetical protein ACFYPK_33000 [Streptomyces halstedii]|uniref:hypothetical protein n=1 Tax=Streptomyces halstedii TaxID=1944 RepID=UPI0036C3F070